jgi:hypothetical protein
LGMECRIGSTNMGASPSSLEECLVPFQHSYE